MRNDFSLFCLQGRFFFVLGAVLSLVFWTNSVQAGCHITLTVQNTGTFPITLHADLSRVKVKKGLWKILARPLRRNWLGMESIDLEPGESKGAVYRATFRCKARRRYQIHYSCQSGPQKGHTVVQYYPVQRHEWDKTKDLTILLEKCG